jgi:hypothetical protein
MTPPRGLVYVTVYNNLGDTLLTLGWVSRSAIHAQLKRRAHQIVGADFYLARRGEAPSLTIIGVGKRTGSRGNWTRRPC